MRQSIVLSAALVPGLLAPLAGAEPAATERVFVTATRTTLAEDEILAPIVVITREELERATAADVADLLRFRAGIEIARTGGPGQTTTLFMRGTESNHTLVLVDGVRINPGTIGVAALQNISPELIERIEIVKGPRSTIYGSDAIGGVINVITRSGARDGVVVSLGAGQYGTRDASLTAGASGEAGDLTLGTSWLDSSGFPTRKGDETDRGYRNLSFNVAGRSQVGSVELSARAWHAEGTSEYSDFFLTPVDQDFTNSAASLSAAFAPTAGWRSKLTASLMRDETRQNQANFMGQKDFLRTRRWSADWQNDVAVGEHHAITAGALLQRETADTLSYGSGFDVGTDVNLYYVQDRITAGRHRGLLAVGLTDHETFGSQVTWNAEYGFELRPGTSIYTVAGTAFRAPDATDRYGYGGNPALDPERSRSLELGLRHRIDGGHSLSLGVFRNDLDDLIQFVVTDMDSYEGENRNVERARIEGIEASWDYEGALWRARAAVTLQEPRDLSSGTRLLRRADENYTLALARRIGAHEVALDALVAGDRLDFGFPSAVRLGGYTVVNLSGRFAVTRALGLTARLENVFDRDYELARGYNTMGRSLFVAARYDFR